MKYKTWSLILNTPLFHNDNITVNSKHVFLPFLYNNGIRFIKDLILINGNFRDLKSRIHHWQKGKHLNILWITLRGERIYQQPKCYTK